jgi:hypothetical protein
MTTGESESVVRFADAKRLYLIPYLVKYPEGKYSSEFRNWLDDAEVAILEAQAKTKARGKREGRNRYEKALIVALQAEGDKDRNLLESIELFQLMIQSLTDRSARPSTVAEEAAAEESGDVAGDPKYWRMLADRHLQKQKQALLTHEERNRIIRERMEAAEKLIASEKPEDGQQIFLLFRTVFRAETDLDPWLDYAGLRLENSPAEMPSDQPKPVN